MMPFEVHIGRPFRTAQSPYQHDSFLTKKRHHGALLAIDEESKSGRNLVSAMESSSLQLPESNPVAALPREPISSPLVIVSPHYDDAVFSCGHLLAAVPGSTVLTVCTGLPEDSEILTDWDERCGFRCAADAMRARAVENDEALALLSAKGMNLDFLDSQYDQRQKSLEQLLGDTLGASITQLQPASVCFPIGLFHEDHILISDVLMTICHHFSAINWYAYEDIPYCKRPEWVDQRLHVLSARGIAASPHHLEAQSDSKWDAVSAYRSQFLGLGYEDASPVLGQPERYWKIHRSMELL